MKDIYLKNVATLKLDSSKCTSCGLCLDVCPRDVLSMPDDTLTIAAIDRCIECGACSLNCPFDALSVKPGVGCASAIIKSKLTGKEAECGCCSE
jgi:ferredoxin